MSTDTLTRPNTDLEELLEEELSCSHCDNEAEWTERYRRCKCGPQFWCDMHYQMLVAARPHGTWVHCSKCGADLGVYPDVRDFFRRL